KKRALCWMDVDGETVEWAEGQTFVFDDTYPHEVWNDTDQHRVILLIQFERPMGIVGRIVAGLFIRAVRFSPYIQDARRNVDHWERRMRDSEGRLAA
ncbi:MAG TPA: aspartyl/asparaginyl beta-hydroxylase domain-containing protein, partial [Sphingomicrobium sp.]|nr:aspartyl/asparaginyl beta-hydroxylase domain-containing protein [Sphingomicrobium sp.]